MTINPPEVLWLWAGFGCYLMGAIAAVRSVSAQQRAGDATSTWLAGGLVAIAVAIAARWLRLGHGPFLSMFEILLSNLFSLGAVFAVVSWRAPRLRPSAVVVLPLLLLLALWALTVKPTPTHLPPTYDTPILWLHVAAGKLFLGLSLVAVGLSGIILLRRLASATRWFAAMPDDDALDAWVWRFMLGAVVFETLMLIAGALWAQDAWGRYWAWDPLEIWAFVTWLAAAAAIHARLAYRVSPVRGALMVLGVFIIAFLTFFGVPFLSPAPHKGAV